MTRLFQPLWLLLASTADSKLAPVVEYLQAENRILRARLPDRVAVTPRERERLIQYGSVLGAALASIITIVSYRTFRRWVTEPGEGSVSKRRPDREPGRPRTEEDLRALIVRLARENSWGYTRVLGELKKLGITTVNRPRTHCGYELVRADTFLGATRAIFGHPRERSTSTNPFRGQRLPRTSFLQQDGAQQIAFGPYLRRPTSGLHTHRTR